MNLKVCCALVGFLFSTVIFAQHGQSQNEDVQWIREWSRTQSITELAGLLDLSADQVATLRTIRGRVDAVEADFDAQFEALQAQIATSAAEIRARIEQTNTLSDEDEATLNALRTQYKDLQQEKRGAIGEAAQGLKDVLTADQLQIVRTWAQSLHGGEGDEGPAAGDAPQGGPRGGASQGGPGGNAASGEQGGREHGRKLARILLSDALLNAYN